MTSDIQYAINPAVWARECLNISPDSWQEKVLKSDSKRMILNCSRQSGKSTIAAVVALHRAIYYPGSLILLVSPSMRQSSELFRKVTDFGGDLKTLPDKVENNRLSLRFVNQSRIVSLPSSEATVRGFSRASLIVEDEAGRVPDDLYFAIRPMLAVSDGRLILMSTPFGKRGHFYETWEHGGNQWERVSIPACACPRISEAFLKEELITLGSWWYSQEYECKFVQTTDQVFDYNLVMNALSHDVVPLFMGEDL